VPSGYRGSEGLDPLEIGQVILFIQKHGKTVRGMGYQLDIDGYSSSELSVLSSHLTEGTRVVRWAYQQEPWSVVWMVLDNGVVLALTVQQEHQVTAWTRQVFNGYVKDICTVSGETQDEVYMLIDTRLVILRIREDIYEKYKQEDYLDDGVAPYVSVFESMEFEQMMPDGTLQGRHKHVSGATIRLFRTAALKAGVITENSQALDRAQGVPYTGDINLRLPGGMGKTCRVRIENDYPGPMTVLGIFKEVTAHGG